MARVKIDLHEAMILAMVRARRFTMPATELTEAINEGGLFVRRDRQPLPASRILARARRKTYQDLFRVRGPKGAKTVSLRRPKSVET